jgi:hypothetical protein
MPLKLDTRLPRWIRKTPATRTALALVLGLLAVPLLASPVAPQKDKPIKGAGVEVTVTPEMTGAGMRQQRRHVASHPASHRQPQQAGGVLGQAAALPHPDCRPAQQPADRSCARQAHRLGFSSPNLKVYRGNEDVNFSADGKLLAVSEEDNYDVHIVDYEKRAAHLDLRHARPARQWAGC